MYLCVVALFRVNIVVLLHQQVVLLVLAMVLWLDTDDAERAQQVQRCREID